MDHAKLPKLGYSQHEQSVIGGGKENSSFTPIWEGGGPDVMNWRFKRFQTVQRKLENDSFNRILELVMLIR